MQCILVSPRADSLQNFVQAFEKHMNGTLTCVDSEAKALDLAKAPNTTLVIIDEKLTGAGNYEIIKQLLMTNAMVNTSVLTDMDEKEFDDKSEGLGVLMPLPLGPTDENALALANKLKSVLGM